MIICMFFRTNSPVFSAKLLEVKFSCYVFKAPTLIGNYVYKKRIKQMDIKEN